MKLTVGIIGLLALVAVAIIPMITHIVWCIQMASETGSAIALLIVGLLLYPVGWIHGVCLILGFGGWI